MLLVVGLLACSAEGPSEGVPERPEPVAITVLAASSLADALPQVAEAWTSSTGHRATFAFDASSRLAKQLESGARADVFVSADVEWMDWASDRGLVRADTRRDLLGNELVLVVPFGATFVPRRPSELDSPAVAHLALAGENVPAGRYARAALAHAGVWDAVSARVVEADSVRTALGWVAKGEAEAGVVYATDARVEPAVTVAFAFPSESHPPIVYPGAVTSTSPEAAVGASFLDFCAGPGRSTLASAGFRVLPP